MKTKNDKPTTVAKCGFKDGEAVAIRAYDFEDWCFGILCTLPDGKRGIHTKDRSYPGVLDPRNQIRRQTFKTYTQVVHVREDGNTHFEPMQEVQPVRPRTERSEGDNNPRLPKKELWGLWRDFTAGTTRSWRMRTPIGVMAFKTKKEAVAAKDEYERFQAV